MMLNDRQEEAVSHINGPVLVLSGAGTGKTRVITARFINLINNFAVSPDNILVLTFTNKAATEMYNRINASLEGVHFTYISTFHRFGLRLLQSHYEQRINVLNTSEQLQIVKRVLQNNNIDNKLYKKSSVLDYIQRCKDKHLNDNEISQNNTQLSKLDMRKIYKEYQEIIDSMGACDYGDLLLKTYKLLSSSPDILSYYQNKFCYIMVDEYQDTNNIQYDIIKLLADNHKNLCCVGDDDQSIYSWRGANINNILRFEDDFSNAKIIRLEENYRSTSHIVEAASHLIANNNNRMGKSLVAHNQNSVDNSKIIVNQLYNDYQQADWICSSINGLRNKNIDLNNIAILVRMTSQINLIEQALLQSAIPYHVMNLRNLYEGRIFLDLISYIKLVLNNKDDAAFMRVINIPKRGIGNKTIEEVFALAKQNSCSLFDCIKNFEQFGRKKSILEFIDLIINLQKCFDEDAIDQTIDKILLEVKYFDYIKGQVDNYLEQIDNIKSIIAKFDSINSFLEHIALISDADDVNQNNSVNLMTIHAAKGLEFDYVFLPGWQENTFPSYLALNNNSASEIEEERRLAYVAMTRAKKAIFISHVDQTYQFGNKAYCSPSRFINEIPEKYKNQYNKYNESYIKKNTDYAHNNNFVKNYNDYSVVFNDGKKNNNIKSTKVFNKKFGYGKIMYEKGDLICVNFDSVGMKMISSSFVNLIE